LQRYTQVAKFRYKFYVSFSTFDFVFFFVSTFATKYNKDSIILLYATMIPGIWTLQYWLLYSAQSEQYIKVYFPHKKCTP
jgi:hypothetical protein